MAGVGDLDDDCVNHRQVQGGHHPVVKETGVEHLAVVAHEVLFVQRPTQALDGAALELAFHVAGVDRLSGVLEGGATENLGLAGFRVDFHVHQGRRQGSADAPGVNVAPSHYRPAGLDESGRDLLEGQFQFRVGLVLQRAVDVLHVIR